MSHDVTKNKNKGKRVVSDLKKQLAEVEGQLKEYKEKEEVLEAEIENTNVQLATSLKQLENMTEEKTRLWKQVLQHREEVYIHMYTCTCTSICIHVHVHVYMYIYVCMYVYVYEVIYNIMYVCVIILCIYTYMYIRSLLLNRFQLFKHKITSYKIQHKNHQITMS